MVIIKPSGLFESPLSFEDTGPCYCSTESGSGVACDSFTQKQTGSGLSQDALNQAERYQRWQEALELSLRYAEWQRGLEARGPQTTSPLAESSNQQPDDEYESFRIRVESYSSPPSIDPEQYKEIELQTLKGFKSAAEANMAEMRALNEEINASELPDNLKRKLLDALKVLQDKWLAYGLQINASITNREDQAQFERRVVELVNVERVREGLPALIWNDDLATMARSHAMDMCDRNFYDHTNPDGENLAARARSGHAGRFTYDPVEFRHISENIFLGPQTPEVAVSGWMESEGHRNNIMKPESTETGVGYYTCGENIYWVHIFRKQ